MGTNRLPKEDSLIDEIEEDVYVIYGKAPSSHVYLVKGAFKNVLIDTGIKGNFPRVVEGLAKVGLKVKEIDIVISTHEHFDHIGGNIFFNETAVTAAHRFAATKVELQDEFVVHSAIHGEEIIKTKFHLWLENRTLFDLGNYKLKIFHTPGHTSGCICIMEPFKGFMFTGDTIFDGGVISKISESGSYGDYINSLERMFTMKVTRIFPGHGRMCNNPDESLKEAIHRAKKKLSDYKEELLSRINTKDAVHHWKEQEDGNITEYED
jgi:glyoxylase-like metal-dependent hydrolase (beta-lactamase superfamily II)